MVKRTLQKDEKHQKSHPGDPAPALVTIEQLQCEKDKEREKEITAPADMPYAEMGKDITVEMKQEEEYRIDTQREGKSLS